MRHFFMSIPFDLTASLWGRCYAWCRDGETEAQRGHPDPKFDAFILYLPRHRLISLAICWLVTSLLVHTHSTNVYRDSPLCQNPSRELSLQWWTKEVWLLPSGSQWALEPAALVPNPAVSRSSPGLRDPTPNCFLETDNDQILNKITWKHNTSLSYLLFLWKFINNPLANTF